MPQTTINAQSATTDITIAGKSYRTIFSDVAVDATTDQIDSSVFASEPDGEFEPGSTRLILTLAGLLKKGGEVSGPLIPPPQNQAIEVQYDTDCTINGTFNFRRATARRTVLQNAILSGEAVSTGTFLVAWDQGDYL